MTTPIKKFTIERSKWLQGGWNAVSMLRDRRGNKCCLGFYASACNVKNLTNKYMPDALDEPQQQKLSTKIVKEGSTTYLCEKLIEINDSSLIPNKKRETKIASLFKKAGITVKFTGKYKENQK